MDAEADEEQSSAAAAASCCLLSSAISFSISTILRFLLVTSSAAASSSAHSRAFSASSRSAVSLHLSSSFFLAASSASRNGTMATVSLSIFCSSSSTRKRASRSWRCSMARSSSATCGGARAAAAGRTCADERGKYAPKDRASDDALESAEPLGDAEPDEGARVGVREGDDDAASGAGDLVLRWKPMAALTRPATMAARPRERETGAATAQPCNATREVRAVNTGLVRRVAQRRSGGGGAEC